MSADAAIQSPDKFGSAGERSLAGLKTPDGVFWKALIIAALFHASFFLTLLRSEPTRLGETGGADDAINVSLVTEADLESRATVPDEAAPGAPAPPPQQAAPQQQPPPPAEPVEPQKPAEAEPQPVQPQAPELKSTLPAEDPAKPDPEPKPKPEPPAEAAAPTEQEFPELFELPVPGALAPKTEPAKPKKPAAAAKPPAAAKPSAKPPQRQASLDQSLPAATFRALSGAGGRSGGLSRPPGITRSGENDEFARRVVRALQATIPQLRETRGRVTVRILLNDNGNVTSVEVVRPSPLPNLDQSVVFAARQTSYPFPPINANLADRTFLVTYIFE